MAAGGASIPIRLVLTSSFPWLRFLRELDQLVAALGGDDRMGPHVLEVDLVADLEQHVGGVCRSSQSTVLVTAAFTAASSFKVPLCLP